MIRVIFGEKGAGKTKRIIDMANESLKAAKGSIVFIDDDNQYMFDLKNAIRFIDASEYHIDGPKMFYGFLAGISAQDFDLEYIFIDGFAKIVHHPVDTLEGLFKELDEFAVRSDTKIVISISGSGTTPPDFIKPYLV
ncbi:MAG: hypothetical protein RR232_02085 [Clostridia bacterium]